MAANKELEQLATVRLKRDCFDLHVNKKVPYRSIADQFGISTTTVQRYVREMIQLNIPDDDLEDLRKVDIDGYMHSEQLTLKSIHLITTQMDDAIKRDVPIDPKLVELLAKLNDQLVSIRKARAMLLGMNKPVLVNHAVAVKVEFDEKMESLVSELTGGGTLLSGPENLLNESE
jgi:DNA-binding Lrp family transcriptional regulator